MKRSVVGAAAACVMLSGLLLNIGAASAAHPFKACLVSGTGEINDHGFNEYSWLGVKQAVRKLGLPSNDAKVLVPVTDSDYTPDIQAFVAEGCNIIVTVSFDAADATASAAQSNPRQKFAIVDDELAGSNIASIVYDTPQVSFLGGYAAAATSKTKIVATFGGTSQPPTNAYMDGFYDGVEYYDQKNHAKVRVLGWNETTQKGLFVNSYSDEAAGERLTQQLISQGADVIMPVAGNVNLGAARAIKQTGHGVALLWTDTSACQAVPQFCSVTLASVMKGLNTSVASAVTAAYRGHFKSGDNVETLANRGVGFQVARSSAGRRIRPKLAKELKKLATEISAGRIRVRSPNAPKF